MDVDRAPGQRFAQTRRQDLHVARQHHQVDALALDQFQDPLLLRYAAAGIDREVVEGHAVAARKLRVVGVVGRHRGDVRAQLAAVGAEQQVVEAVALPAHQHQQSRAPAHVVHRPVHRMRGGQRCERLAHGVDGAGGRDVEMHAQEEASGLGIAELLRVDDVAAVLEQQPGDAMDDAGAVGAGEGEDVVAGHCGRCGVRARDYVTRTARAVRRLRPQPWRCAATGRSAASPHPRAAIR